ncbi:MAG: DUF1566 domain-containing protein [Flavobacterium sp.]|nr:DUF1566 domain-containing protein [Flavobacterium sp.]
MNKKIYSVIAGLLLTISIKAQAPQKMSYQAIIRNNSNTLITTTPIGIRISILQGSVSGTPVYVETQTKSTNDNGLVSLEIGSGTQVIGTFTKINWETGPYFIKTETDPTGGTAYSITGTNELTSVPYALFSANVNNNAGAGNFSHYLGEIFNGGVIFELYKGTDGLEHGLIVAPTESSLLAWQTYGILVNADHSEDGVYNTNIMKNSPAKTYITTLGTGWYLPSIDELNKLYHNRFEVNNALFNNGNTLLSAGTYWSSTEFSITSAYYLIMFGYAPIDVTTKTTSYKVRGIKAF